MEIDPENIEIWLDYSMYYDKLGENESAVEIMMEGLSFHGEKAEFNFRMAAYLLKSGKEPEALIFLGEALLEDYDSYHLLFDYYNEAINNINVNQLIQIFKS